MSAYRTTPAGNDPDRHLMRALAALREAAEHLDEAATASEHPNLGVVSALSHVAAARTTLRSQASREGTRPPDREAA